MIAYVFQKYTENFAFQLFIILQLFTREICYFLKKQPTFQQFLLSFLFINKTLQRNNLKTGAVTNAKISVFAFCVEAFINLSLYNLHDCTFKLHSNQNALHRIDFIGNTVTANFPAYDFKTNRILLISCSQTGRAHRAKISSNFSKWIKIRRGFQYIFVEYIYNFCFLKKTRSTFLLKVHF